MSALRAIYLSLRHRIPEVYFRAVHAHRIFSKRFFTLSILGHVELEPGFGFDENRAIDRGNCAPDGCYYSKYHTLSWAETPSSVKQAIKNYDDVIRMYLGDGYLINDGLFWRNYSIPAEYRNTELFSQYWHYDKVVDFRNIQLFILLGDATVDHGPLEYVVNQDDLNILPSVLDRDNQDIALCTRKFIGKRGDTLLLMTGSTPHRAGIPAEGMHRDIFSVAFFPAYTKIGRSSLELLCQNV